MSMAIRATDWLITTRYRPAQVALVCWAATSLLVAMLPAGAGGWPRTLNAVVFLVFGPGCALAWHLGRSVPPAVAAVIALAASLAVLLLSSQLLLILGLWAPWGVTALVYLATVGLVAVPVRKPAE
jgi:hypothetical protein